MLVTTDELACVFRSDVDDVLEGVDSAHPDSENLWSNSDVFGYMEEAADAVARATNGLLKSYALPVTANNPVILLPRAVLQVNMATLVSNQCVVAPSNEGAVFGPTLIDDYGDYVVNGPQVTGTPQVYARDHVRKALYLWPIPNANDTLNLYCSVTLSTPLLPGMMLPFQEHPDQRLMLSYMKYLAYAKQDADTLDLSRSAAFKSEFDNNVVLREVGIRRQRRLPSAIQMEW